MEIPIEQLLFRSSGWSFLLTLIIVIILGSWAVLLAPVWMVVVIGTQKLRHY